MRINRAPVLILQFFLPSALSVLKKKKLRRSIIAFGVCQKQRRMLVLRVECASLGFTVGLAKFTFLPENWRVSGLGTAQCQSQFTTVTLVIATLHCRLSIASSVTACLGDMAASSSSSSSPCSPNGRTSINSVQRANSIGAIYSLSNQRGKRCSVHPRF